MTMPSWLERENQHWESKDWDLRWDPAPKPPVAHVRDGKPLTEVGARLLKERHDN